MKRIGNYEKHTLMLMSVMIILLIISATVAWFTGFHPALLNNTTYNLDDRGEVYAWVKVEEDIEQEDMDNILSLLKTHIDNYNRSVSSAGNISDAGNVATSGELSNNTDRLKTDLLPTDSEMLANHFLPLKNVGTGETINYTIDMNIVRQENIQEHTLAPGAFGKIEFKLLSMTDRTNGFTLTITPDIMHINEAFENNAMNLTDEELLQLVKTHIKFYQVDEEGQYSEVIPYVDEHANAQLNCMTGNLEEGVMKDVTIYWYWPYEYTDIPTYDLTDEESPVYEEYDKYRTLATEMDRIESYDWDDTYIGNYVEGLRFHFMIRSNRE